MKLFKVNYFIRFLKNSYLKFNTQEEIKDEINKCAKYFQSLSSPVTQTEEKIKLERPTEVICGENKLCNPKDVTSEENEKKTETVEEPSGIGHLKGQDLQVKSQIQVAEVNSRNEDSLQITQQKLLSNVNPSDTARETSGPIAGGNPQREQATQDKTLDAQAPDSEDVNSQSTRAKETVRGSDMGSYPIHAPNDTTSLGSSVHVVIDASSASIANSENLHDITYISLSYNKATDAKEERDEASSDRTVVNRPNDNADNGSLSPDRKVTNNLCRGGINVVEKVDGGTGLGDEVIRGVLTNENSLFVNGKHTHLSQDNVIRQEEEEKKEIKSKNQESFNMQTGKYQYDRSENSYFPKFYAPTIILGDSPSYKLYNTLNENGNKSAPNNYCISRLQRFKTNYPKCTELCEKYAKNLENLSVIIQNVDNDIERCRYLNLWIYSEIRKKFPRYVDKIYELPFMRIYFSEFHLIQKSLNKQCIFTYNKKISSDLWNKFKHIHDFFKNIQYIKSKIADDENNCSKYSEYLKYIKEIYTTYESECCNNVNGNCPPNLNFNDWCGMESEISEIKCNETETPAVSESDDLAESTENPGNMEQPKGHSGVMPQEGLAPADNRIRLVDPDIRLLEKDDSNINVVTPTILSCLGTFTTTYLLYKVSMSSNKNINFCILA
ncbi:hypothetical protein PVNG_04433 [Plasmodium vivax North Korean]|uniref:Uncharacterized protein n=1 Tax=Plasmodium vivax North Korean TaxID=1035514 RepID=A0A0J9U1W9_PLAVI|nr:hypothetical protein PVNG_04433 [Plasmodium vivax North Korean]